MTESQPCTHGEHLPAGEAPSTATDPRSPSPHTSSVASDTAPVVVTSCPSLPGNLTDPPATLSREAGAAAGSCSTPGRPLQNSWATVTKPRRDTFGGRLANARATPAGTSLYPPVEATPWNPPGLESIPERVRTRLEKKLLALGGTRVIWHPDPDAAQVLARGRLFTEPICLTPDGSEQCHANATERWARDTENSRLATGYALSNGEWMSHSWVLAEGQLHETTGLMDQYFGIILNRWVSLRFFVENVVARRYPDLCGVSWNMFDPYPGLLKLMQQVVRMGERQFNKVFAEN